MKAKPKTKATAKPVAKSARTAPKSKPVAKASKPANKPASKSASKPAAKAAPKASKPAAKAAPKASKPAAKKTAKPAAKAAPKASKPAAKKPVKPAAKPAPKVSKPTAKKPVKPAAKPAPKVSKPAAKKPAKPAAKPAPKVSKPAAKKPPQPAAKAAKPAAAPVAPPSAKKTVVPAPAPAPADAGRKLTGRAAKAAAGVPPPPSTVPFSNPAKASFGPEPVQRMPALVPIIPKKDPKLANNWKKKPVEQLSDDEVLAMSDAEYMNNAQMAFFRLKLLQLKRDILANAGETTEHLREDTVIVPDPADRATIEEEHALELRTRDRERKLLKKIEQSIQRIDMGDYGYCDETGEPIGVARLLARPTATLSLEAQQRRELKQKMFGD